MPMRIVVLVCAFAVSCGGNTPEPSPAPPPPGPPADDVVQGGPCAGPPPGPGYECVQDCGPPVVQAGDPPPGHSWLSAEDARRRDQFGCPICLPADARIATPDGSQVISALEPGAIVWSVDERAGRRVATRVLEVVSTPAPDGHPLVVVELADGRVVRASPGHPAADGRALGSLVPGDAIDGSVVVAVRRTPYRGRTYDLVLDEDRAHYVSDGVLLRTTLDEE